MTYQLPALLLEGTTVVVSPLIALMKDQLDMLRDRGITDVVALNSTLSEDQEIRARERIASGEDPDRVHDAGKTRRRSVPHCSRASRCRCSSWTKRTVSANGVTISARRISRSATSSPTGASDGAGADRDGDALGARRHPAPAGHRTPSRSCAASIVPISCTKPRKADKEADKLKILNTLFDGDDALEAPASSTPRRSRTRSKCSNISRANLDIPAAVYHSKLHKEDRTSVHNLFMGETIRAVVATNAFGLGIDKPNIRFVLHYDLPGSLEAYTQEAGRAGRDGLPSRCILIYRMSDTRVQNYFLTGKYPDIEEVQRVFGTIEVFGDQSGGVSMADLRKISQLPLTKLQSGSRAAQEIGLHRAVRKSAYGLTEAVRKNRDLMLSLANYETKKSYDQSKLAMMLQYAETTSCRRRFILNYFGEDFDDSNCGACDNCLRALAARLDEGATTGGFRIADVVQHPKFGIGTVERTERDLVTVLFPSVGYKTLLASAVRHAEPQIA